MDIVHVESSAYAKIILHAAKYPYCAVNGVLLADNISARSGNKNHDLYILDAVPLFHHSHYLSPMAEVALTQIETMAQADNRVIVGYYAACENFRDNTVEKCPGLKIAEKIVEHFPSAVFIVVDHSSVMDMAQMLYSLKVHKYSEGKWRPKDASTVAFRSPYILKTLDELLNRGVQKELIDFDNYLDDLSQDWTNLGIEKLIASVNASNSINNDYEELKKNLNV